MHAYAYAHTHTHTHTHIFIYIFSTCNHLNRHAQYKSNHFIVSFVEVLIKKQYSFQ